MVVWVASYPRSGNTLVRTILKSCFELRSFDSELPAATGNSGFITETIGHQEPDRPWSEFHASASRSPGRYFVKTHSPPPDEQPCIYIVRNGRKAVLSYYYHFQQFFPQENRSLLELVLGYDHYGDWTSHYRAWNPEARPCTLLVRYEALLRHPEAEIARLERFLGLAASRPWQNPFASLRQHDSEFFRKGTAEWEPDPLWTPQIEEVFRVRHGTLMQELGYPALDPRKDYLAAGDGEAAFLADVVQFAARVQHAKAQSDEAAAERLDLIHRLVKEAETRRLLIEKLHADIQELNRRMMAYFPASIGHL